MVNMFANHLHFFGNQTDIASEGLRGMFVMDEAGAVSQSTMGRAVPWSECGLPDAHHIPLHAQDQYRKEWVRIPAEHDGVQYEEREDDMVLYHGTIGESAFKAVNVGFIPGPNGHVKRKKYYEGAFMSKDFFTASFRGDMTRRVRDDFIYDFGSCPCVLEMRTKSALLVNYHKTNPDLFVLPGTKGKLLQGLRIEAVHFNSRFVENHKKLHCPQLRKNIQEHGGVLQCICGVGRQTKDFCSCGKVSFDPWNEFRKLGKYYVCEDCYESWKQ